MFELNNKFILRSYSEFKNRINYLKFAQDNKRFVSCANETSIKLWDIQNTEKKPIIQFMAAHADNIKKVDFLP